MRFHTSQFTVNAMLPLSRQNAYRERYKRLRPGWRTSGEELEALVRGRLAPQARVLDLGCGRGGVMELFWREALLAVGLDPDYASLVEHRAARGEHPFDRLRARPEQSAASSRGTRS